MEREANIVAKLRDEVSDNANRMGDSVKRFSKDAGEADRVLQALGKRQEEISRQMAKTQTDLFDANNELKKAKAAYASLNDEVSRKELERANERVNKLTTGLKDYKRAAGDTQRAMRSLHEQERKENNRGGESSMLGQLGKAGLTKMVGDTLSAVANVAVGSAFGSDVGTLFSATLSGAAAGAALGSLAGPMGTAIGGAVGGVVGLVGGATQVAQKKDEAFKGYVQESAEAQLSERSGDIQSGSAIAAQRQQDVIAFNRLLGEGTGDRYLEDLRTMAAKTPMEYSDLTTMSRSLTTGFKDDPQRMLALMEAIGDAGSAVGVDAQGMNTMATAMSRMQSSGKVTMEYLNLIQERGVDAVGMLADGLGVAKGEVYDLISKGKLGGVEAVQVIQDKMGELYGGAMELQSKTFSGLSSTLADARAEMQNAYGEGYNEERGVGLKREADYLTGPQGEKMQEANKAIGAWYASLENEKERLIRRAQNQVLESDAYQIAMAAGTNEGYAEAGRMMMEAKAKAQDEYNASDGAQLLLESEKALIAGIREHASLNSDYHDAGYELGKEFSKGVAAGMLGGIDTVTQAAAVSTSPDTDRRSRNFLKPHAAGLPRVPYDNYPALLHEGERVLTAREVRQQDDTGAGGVSVAFTGPITVTEQTDLDALAGRLAQKVMAAKAVQAPQ